MKLLTLTPEAHAYAVAALVLCSLSCGELANHLRMRCPGLRQAAFFPVYVVTMAVVSGFAVLVLDLPSVVRLSWTVLALSLPLGVAAGAVAWWGGLAVKRHLLRRSLLRPRRARIARPRRSERTIGSPAEHLSRASSWPAWSERVTLQERRLRPNHLSENEGTAQRYRVLGWLLLAGVLEEVLFRGVLVELILDLESPVLIVLCLVATVVVFAMSHLRLGYGEGLAKLPLGSVTLLVALLTRSVVPALVAHVFFNLWAWRAAPAEDRRGAARW